MNFLQDMFEDENGGTSCMRIMAFIALFAAIGLAFTGHDTSVTIFITAAFGGKFSQKWLEIKGGKND